MVKKIVQIRKSSSRCGNNLQKIKRNILQKIIPDWINYKEKNKKKWLKKLDPKICIKNIDIKYMTIEDIFQMNHSGIKAKNENINIIIKNTDEEKKIKLQFTFLEIVKALYYKNLREQLLFEKMPNIKSLKKKEREDYISKFFEGLKDIEEYFTEKTYNYTNLSKRKMKTCLNIFKDSIINEE